MYLFVESPEEKSLFVVKVAAHIPPAEEAAVHVNHRPLAVHVVPKLHVHDHLLLGLANHPRVDADHAVDDLAELWAFVYDLFLQKSVQLGPKCHVLNKRNLYILVF